MRLAILLCISCIFVYATPKAVNKKLKSSEINASTKGDKSPICIAGGNCYITLNEISNQNNEISKQDVEDLKKSLQVKEETLIVLGRL